MRAVAILAIVLFHFKSDWLPGGFAGVDVFFVISGFLMTAIILRRLENGSFSLIDFYVSRAKRIIPPLLVLCLVLLIFGWFYLFPHEYKRLGKGIASSIGFFSNIIFWIEGSDYFHPSSKTNWLLHTWALSVEWQFYLIYPIVLLAFTKFIKLKYIRWFFLIITFSCLLFSIFTTYRWPNSSYYLLPSRVWEMMAGGTVFLFPITLSQKTRKIIELLGLSLIIVSYIIFSESTIFWPGYLASVPVLGTLMIITANKQESFLTNNKISNFIGKASYSIYLWHWPIVVFYSYQEISGWLAIWGLAISLVLGSISYIKVERLNIKSITRPGLKLALCSLFIFTLGGAVFLKNGVKSFYRPLSISENAFFLEKYANYRDKNKAKIVYRNDCDFYSSEKNNLNSIDRSCVPRSASKGVFLWGDSHASALSYGLTKTLPDGIPLYQVFSSSCKPAIIDESIGPPKARNQFTIPCYKANKYALQAIKEVKPSIVIMAQIWKHEWTDFSNIANILKRNGVDHVVLIGPVPQWEPSLPDKIVRGGSILNGKYIAKSSIAKEILYTNKNLRRIYSNNNQVHYISIMDELCKDDECLFKVNNQGELLVYDYGHLTIEGSLYVVKNIIYPQLKKILN